MRHYIFSLFLLVSLVVAAQEGGLKDKNQERMDKFQKNKIDSKKPAEESRHQGAQKEGAMLFTDTAKIEVRSFPDVSKYYSECYAKVVNRYGFWQGVGPKLTKDDIRHMRGYVKLLRPAGQPSTAPFTHMQVLDPFGELDNNSYGPILANPFGNDKGISSSWEWKLKYICQFEKIYRNGVVIQENMYNDDGKLVLQYFPTSVSKNQIIGHYTDAYGTLAKLRKDEKCTYLGITLDNNGYESQVSFMDTDGRLRRNGDDAFIQLFKRDSNGNYIQITSADAVGNPIIDNCGNCGWQYTYDKNGHIETSTCINQFGLPQRMSKKRDNHTKDMIRARYTYDRWGNVLTESFYDETWNPDTITGGIHRYVYTYSLYGNTTSMRAEGLDGHLAPKQEAWRQVLDNHGHRVYYVALNSDSLLSSNGTCISRAHYENGDKIWEEKYTSPNGVDSVLSSRYVRTPSCDSTFNYDNGYINIERYDERRRLVSDEYYDLNGSPIQRLNYHKHTITYSDSACCTIKEGRYLDENDHPCKIVNDYWRWYNIEVVTHDPIHKTYSDLEYDGQMLIRSTVVDSVKRQRTITKYNEGRIVEKYGFDLSENCENVEGQLFFDSIGCHGRTFKANALYYKARKHINIQGNTVAWQGFNEFGEPSYILNGDWDGASLYCTNVVGDPYYYDENGDSIPRVSKELRSFKNKLSKAFCIELINPVALKYGLRTGDLIVRYGDWHYPKPSTAGRYRESLLCMESVRKATKEKTMIVMRQDGGTNTSQLIELEMPVGTPKELGFVYHMLYLTEKEKKRYEDVVKCSRSNVVLDSINTGIGEKTKVHFFTPYKVGDDSNKELFRNGLKENVVIIAFEPHVNGKSYLLPCNSDLINHFGGHELDSVTLHYTVDGKNILHRMLSKKEVEEGGRHSYTSVDEASNIYALADSLQKQFDEKHLVERIVLKPHDAAERLLKIPSAKTTQNDGSRYRGIGVGKYGNVNSFYNVYIDYDSLSYDDMFLANNIIRNVDFSDYCYMHNDKDYGFFLEEKGRFTECTWTTNKGLVFLSDSVDFYDKSLITAEVKDSGFFRQKGLNGKYVILKCNNWSFGKKKIELSNIIKAGGHRTFIMVKLEGEEGNYTLGHKVKLKAPGGELDIELGWESVSDKIFYNAYKLAEHIKKKRY